MLFNSVVFAIFLPIVFTIFWLTHKSIKKQNIVLVIASYIFYGWWNWRFLFLIILSTVVDYTIGLKLSKENIDKKRKGLLLISVSLNLGLLLVFKYYNFFISSFTEMFSLFGYELNIRSLNVILPVGISFYTFQTMSYTIDIYKRKLNPTQCFITFSAFVCFFPQLVAGPIERATHLLPQFARKREFEYTKAVDGLKQILWGLFKKTVIADNCAFYANQIFNNSDEYTGFPLILGAILFSFQIYGDFSGYSDIAIGTSRLFGFSLIKNFSFPYFSRNISEFWRRWHISLSTWFRDYVYIPLGGSRVKPILVIRNTFIIFLVSGFWHGANWTFIAWGFLHALYFIPLSLLGKNKINNEIVANGSYFPSFKEGIAILITFNLTAFAWIFFRANSITHAFKYISGIYKFPFFNYPGLFYEKKFFTTIIALFFFLVLEWLGRENEYAIEIFHTKLNKFHRYSFYYFLLFLIFVLKGQQQSFIYFQF